MTQKENRFGSNPIEGIFSCHFVPLRGENQHPDQN
jgi:hypothetical protein